MNAQPDEPSQHEIILHLLHQLPLRTDREQDLDQAGPDQPLRRNGGTAKIDVDRCELAIEAHQRIIDDLPDLAQRVPGRNAIIDLAEQ